MNTKLILLIGTLVAITNAQDATPNPLAIFQDLLDPAKLFHTLQGFTVDKLCPNVCGMVCKTGGAFCIDLPDFLDCKVTRTQCDGACSSVCGCFTKCRADCTTKSACKEGDILCMASVESCTGFCQVQCPGQTLIPMIKGVIGMLTQALAPPKA